MFSNAFAYFTNCIFDNFFVADGLGMKVGLLYLCYNSGCFYLKFEPYSLVLLQDWFAAIQCIIYMVHLLFYYTVLHYVVILL